MSDAPELNLDGTHRLKITGAKHLALLQRVLGMAEAAGVREDEGCKLAGFAFARSLIEGRMHELKAGMIRLNLGLVAKAGLDINAVSRIEIEGTDTVVITLGASNEGES